MACGTKVVSSNASSLPEVGGDVIKYFEPKNIEEMAEVMEKELERKDTEEEKNKRIKCAKNFNFEKTSREVNNAFNSCKKQ